MSYFLFTFTGDTVELATPWADAPLTINLKEIPEEVMKALQGIVRVPELTSQSWFKIPVVVSSGYLEASSLVASWFQDLLDDAIQTTYRNRSRGTPGYVNGRTINEVDEGQRTVYGQPVDD